LYRLSKNGNALILNNGIELFHLISSEHIRQIEKISQEIINSNFEWNKIESACNTLKSENEKSKKALQDIVSDSEQKSFQIDEKEKEINEYDEKFLFRVVQ
jgi:chromosome segregation ATPase